MGGYHHAGPSHLSQSPEGAPLLCQSAGQRIAVQVPGSASHRRSIAVTTASVVSEVGTSLSNSPSIREEGRRGYHHAGPSHASQAPEGAPLPRKGPGQRVIAQAPGSASHRRSIAATTAAVVLAVATSITINQRGGGERGYHHAGPSHASQAPEGAPLPRQGPVQRVVVQLPDGGASHRRSGAATAAAVVLAVAISITINQRGGRERGYHHAGPSHASQAPEGAPLPRKGPDQRVVAQAPGSASHRRSRAATAAAVVSAVATSITINQRGGREDIIMRGTHM